MEAIAIRLSGHCYYVGAITTRLEAIASRFEAMAIRLEPSLFGCQAIAVRMEAIAMRFLNVFLSVSVFFI